jgi:hypothetical protein
MQRTKARALALDPGRREIEPADEGVDEPNGIVGDDIIVDRFWQQQKLRTFESGNVGSDLARTRPKWNPIDNIVWRSGIAPPDIRPKCARHFRLARNANSSQFGLESGAIWRMPVFTVPPRNPGIK